MKKPKKAAARKAPKPAAVHHHHRKHPKPARRHPGQHPGPPAHPGPGPKPPAHKPKAAHHPKAKRHPVRKLALGEGVACCAAEALAASLRLAGVPVGDEDVLALYWRTASNPDAGASIWATLEASAEFGLAGVRPASITAGWPGLDWLDALTCNNGNAFTHYRRPEGWPGTTSICSSLIIGVTLPGGPHALTLDPSGAAWSWGELYDLPALGPGRIDEAWLVDWEV